MDLSPYLWLIPTLPLVGFLINGTVGRKLPGPAVAAIGTTGPALAFVLAVLALQQVLGGATLSGLYTEWIGAGNVSISFGLQIDALSSVMLLVVTGVGSAIHLYSYGYMKDDPGIARFFAYLNLFMVAMLLLVLADNLLLMFVGWEGVGLCSYLLIGFWYKDLYNADCGRKAFVANRVGDLAFLIGMFTLFSLTGSLAYTDLASAIEADSLTRVLAVGPFAGFTVGTVLRIAGSALFIGATGKSAQLPLYTWLPDAMAGPTPVSALIHAATMVTAGVYLIGRLDFMYALLPGVMAVIALVAACTATFAGIIATAQNDIKKVLAYSTISQLGYMFAGMASTVFAAGLFHLVTHAFFKALLFLGAGAVILAMHHEQDIRKMGGLYKDLRVIFVLFGIGALALAGLPPLAGFYSKDAILAGVYLQSAHGAGWMGALWSLSYIMLVFTAGVTAFYTFRLMILTFFGPPADPNRHPHAVHWTVIAALVFLAVLSVVGGFALSGPLEAYTQGVWTQSAFLQHVGHEAMEHAHHTAMMHSVLAVLVGAGSAILVFGFLREQARVVVAGPLKTVHWVVSNKFFVDEIYDILVIRPVMFGAWLLFTVVDRVLVDGLMVEGSGKLALRIGDDLRVAQSGAVNAATGLMAFGSVLILAFLLMGLV